MADQIRQILNAPDKLHEVAKAAFSSIDNDESGELDREELGHAINEFAKELGLPPIDEETVNSVFVGLDTDQSGKLSLAEFKVFIVKTLELLAQIIEADQAQAGQDN